MSSSEITAAPDDASLVDALRSSVRDGMPAAIADLSRLVRIPSVSWPAFDPRHVDESADAVAALLEGLGVFESVQVARAPIGDGEASGKPAVLARRAAKNGKPTILLYAHHDVQPPGQDEDWESPPFEPTLRGERLFGRGAADDKAGVMAHVGAIRAFVETVGADFDLGLAVFIEGEEESGSLSFRNFIQQHRAELEADAIVVADSDNWDVDTPALTVALRGNVAFVLEVRTLAHASHSGMFGGAVPDAMMALVRILASFHGADGAVAVEGLTSQDMQTPEYPESQLREEAGLLEGVTPIGSGSILSRLWAQPAVTVTGVDAPSVANASNTLSPMARARVSVRIAPGQTADSALEAIRQHIDAATPFGAQVSLSGFELGDPFLVDTSGWAVAEARRAMTDAWGVESVETGIGGSIPFIADLVEVFPSAQILVTGVEDPESKAHSPNESLHLGVFQKAILTEALLLARMNARD
ncbi:acetylornithine deacetylase/succinyl-diaminopimelate desuccinylase-like protein [Homoserinimonas aerilata]|uniref:Acetylornithine deacetylase/succinyl-diaminopimelate desuccinylase-like protein n=1 Tax=Homoserinimonas aerilata TaxID=1162970 RepID=A0A542YJ67_9MICO|nr:dipeptidase [Homoserinimonas aerilata]TQL48135.1 acetylornithine deacetylase/succinyl-diaminopimelate desuccinylase-like protein [Homoserinimonas aerilata]